MGVASLIVGIVGIFAFSTPPWGPVFPILGWIFGVAAVKGGKKFGLPGLILGTLGLMGVGYLIGVKVN